MKILPDSQHFDSINELKNSIIRSINNFKLPYEVSDKNDSFFNPEDGTFEVILNKQNEKILIPDDRMYPFLFRGQQCGWTLRPSLYREKSADNTDIFIDRLRLTEFSILLNTHPVVKGFFRKHNFKIDYLGLAQHYGLKTEVIDFTNDLDIALFFSICSLNKTLDCFEPNLNDGLHEAFLYIAVPVFYIDVKTKSFLDNKISVIGMQPFKRPGVQKGFSFHCNQQENLDIFKYSFNYTKEDSKYFFDKFEQGKKLWIHDILAEKAERVKGQTAFSTDTFSQTWVNYPVNGLSKSKLLKLLLEKGVQISTHIDIPKFTASECSEIIDEWNNRQKIQAINQIRRRFWHEKEENTNRVGRRHEFRTIQMLTDIELLRLVGNRSNLEELESNSYNPIHPSKKMSSLLSNQNGESWEKVYSRFELAKSEKFLTESDCLM